MEDRKRKLWKEKEKACGKVVIVIKNISTFVC